MSASALELALALHRVPSMRLALRERSVPRDVGDLLALVGGSPTALARAAGQCGQDPVDVLEAARFFVLEVLLAPGADAYRILGLDRSASDASVKQHYRALQHWLHPDRHGNDAESVHATRINVAWAQLRDPARRRRYDESHAEAIAALQPVTRTARVRMSGRDLPAEASVDWKSIVPALSVLALCLWLAWMASHEPLLPEDPMAVLVAATPGAARDSTRGFPSEAHTSPASRASRHSPNSERAPSIPSRARSASVDDRGERSMLTQDPPEASKSAPVSRGAAPPSGPRTALEDAAPELQASQQRDATSSGREPHADSGVLSAPEGSDPVEAGPAPGTAASPLRSDAWVERVHAVQLRADELWAYLANNKTTPPPIWLGVAALESADRVRRSFADGTSRNRGRLTFSDAQWHIGQDTAEVRVRAEGRGPRAAVHARFGLQAGQWWVEQVALESRE